MAPTAATVDRTATLQKCAERLYKTQNFDPILGKYIDARKDDAIARGEATRKPRPRGLHELPAYVGRSEGARFNILSHEPRATLLAPLPVADPMRAGAGAVAARPRSVGKRQLESAAAMRLGSTTVSSSGDPAFTRTTGLGSFGGESSHFRHGSLRAVSAGPLHRSVVYDRIATAAGGAGAT